MQPLHEAETSLGFILSLSSVYVVHHKSESGNEEASCYRIMEIFRNPETPSLHDLNRWSFHFLLFNKLISQVTFNFKLIQMHSRNLIIILAFNQGPYFEESVHQQTCMKCRVPYRTINVLGLKMCMIFCDI